MTPAGPEATQPNPVVNVATPTPTVAQAPPATPTPADAVVPPATPTPADVVVPTATQVPPGTDNPLLAGGTFSGADVTVPGDGVGILAYQARPAADGPRPAVIVVHENRGLVPYTRDVVDGFASNGYLAIAPDLLSREGGTDDVANVPSALRGISMDRHLSDVDAIVAYLKAQSDVGAIGIVGFCFGGGVAWSAVTTDTDISAAVPFYGSNPPLEGVANITAAVRGVYAELDSRINAGIPAITQALADAASSMSSRCTPARSTRFTTMTTPVATTPQPPRRLGWTPSNGWSSTCRGEPSEQRRARLSVRPELSLPEQSRRVEGHP